MELFNETKNNYFLKLIKLINMIISSDDYIYDEYRKKHHAVPETVKRDVFKNEMKQDLYWYLVLQDYIADSSKLNEEENRLIMTNADKMMYSYYEEPISILPCTAEMTWLKTALEDERACSFFTPEELKELKQIVNLLNSDNTFDKYIVIRHEDVFGDKTDNYDPSDQKFDSLSYSSKLHRIRECLRESWNIKYSYSNGKGIKGRKENQLAEPYKFEYSVTKDELKICAESLDDKRPIKQVINKFKYIEPLKIKQEKRALKELIESRRSKEPLSILIRKSADKDLVKRILAMFAKYDRTVSFNNDGSYSVEVSYFSFQETVLIKDIISFGSQLVIESPKSIRDEMIKMLKSSDW